jgi:hypothetical protein
MSTNHPLSKKTFDRMEELFHEIKRHARETTDNELWGMADELGFLLRDFVMTLMIEEGIPEPGIAKASQSQP